MGAVIAKTLRFQLSRMGEQAETIRNEENREAVHQFRVAVRRMRAAFAIFNPYLIPIRSKAHKRALKTLGKVSNPARDLDVMVGKAGDYQVDLSPGDAAAFAPFFRVMAERRETARDALVRALASAEHARFMAGFDGYIDRLMAREVMAGAAEIGPMLREQRRRTRDLFADPTTATLKELHTLRVRMKVLRYAVEFFEDLLGDAALPMIEQMKALQDHLGDLNDSAVAWAISGGLLGDWASLADRYGLAEETRAAWVTYRARQTEIQDVLIGGFPALWQEFTSATFDALLDAAIESTMRSTM